MGTRLLVSVPKVKKTKIKLYNTIEVEFDTEDVHFCFRYI